MAWYFLLVGVMVRTYSRGRGRGRGRLPEVSPQASQAAEASQNESVENRETSEPVPQAAAQDEPAWVAQLATRLRAPAPVPVPPPPPPPENKTPVDKIRKYGAYDFEGTTAEGAEGADEWLHKMQQVFGMLKCSDEDKLMCIMTLLKGVALRWWENVIATTPEEQRTWEFFMNQFDKRFMGNFYREKMHQKFVELRQGSQSVEEYNANFTKLLRHAEGMAATEQRKCGRYIRGLHVEYQGILTAGPKDNLSAIMNTALELEQIELAKERKTEKRKAKKPPLPTSTGYGNPMHKKQKGELSQRRSQGPGIPRPRGERGNDRASNSGVNVGGFPTNPVCDTCKKRHSGECRWRDGRCFKCGDPNHMIRDCPIARRLQKAASSARAVQSNTPAQRARGTEARGSRAQGSRRETGAASEVRTTGRLYAIREREAVEEADVIRGKFSFTIYLCVY
jgi:hypothetical protein